MKALRVLHVTPYSGEAWAYGGIPRLSDALARGLAARGHQVTVCTTDACDAQRRLTSPAGGTPGLAPWPPVNAPNLTTRVFPNLSNRLAYHFQGFLPLGMGGFLKRHASSFDVAHLHACRNLPGVLAARHLDRAGVPYVLAPNGTAPNLERRRLAKQLFDAALGRRVLDRASRVLAVTEAERYQLLALGVPEPKIAVVPNPVELEEFTPEVQRGRSRGPLGVPDGTPLVVFLGKLTPRKRVDLLIRAFATLGRTKARLVVAGNDMGGEDAARAVVSQLGVGERVVFTGMLLGRARLELLADADVVVYPSEHEIFGLVPLEALLTGSPVVVTGDSGCGEVIAATGGGLVVRGDTESIRAAIEHVLDAPAHWRAAAHQAAKRVRALYAPQVVCSRLEHVYAELAA